jgi:hypothetical protein
MEFRDQLHRHINILRRGYRLSPKTEKLSLEETMDLSRDRVILELELEYQYINWRADLTLILCGKLSLKIDEKFRL